MKANTTPVKFKRSLLTSMVAAIALGVPSVAIAAEEATVGTATGDASPNAVQSAARASTAADGVVVISDEENAAESVYMASTSDDVIVGETVVVTAARTQQKLLDVNASMSVVTPESSVSMGRDNIPEMLRNVPSVRLMSDGTPGVKRVAIRGENASRTLVLVDGQRIDDQKNKSGAPLLINPYFVERIEVVKGPSSVLYGSDAIGGIVNVISKQASDKPFTFDGGVGFNGANNSFSEYANIAGTLDRFKYAVGAFNVNAGDLYLSDHDRLDNTSYNARGVNADFSYDILDNLTLGYAGEYFYSDAETSTTTDDATYSVFRGEIPEWSRQKHKLYFKAYDINDYIAAIDGSIYVQNNDKEFNSTPQRGLAVDVLNEQDTIGGNLQFEFSLSDMFYLVTGYEGRQESLDSSSNIGIAMGPVSGDINVRDGDYKQQSHALYAMLSTYLTDELTLNTGIRYNYVKTMAGDTHVSGQMNVPNAGAIPIRMDPQYDDQSQTKTVGSVGLVYRPWKEGAFRINWSQGFRVPNIQEMFLITSTGTLQYGNPDLKPEESNNYEIGFRWEDPRGLNADVAVFYTDASDYIETVNQGQFYTYRNIATAKSYGIDIAASYLIANYYEPYVNFTVMERKYETASGSSTNTGTPRFSGNAGLRFYGQLFELDAYANYATRTKNDNLDGSSYFGDVEYGGYVTYNLSISTKVGPNDAFTLYGSVENILDKNYQTNELIHEPGRFFTLGLKAKF